MALTTNINYLQPTSFKVVIDRVNYPNLEFFAQSVQHPSISLTAADAFYSRVSSVPFPGDKLTFGELSAMVIVDEDMAGYMEMYRWMERLVETNYVTPMTKKFDTDIPSVADVTVSVLSSHNNKTKRIRYIDCVPTLLGDLEFTATVSDIQYLTFQIAFRFSYFTVVD